MLEKKIIDTISKKIKHGAIGVTFWDGDTRIYGKGKPHCIVTYKDPKVVRAMMRNATVGFCEGYMDGLIEVKGSLTHLHRIIIENQKELSGWLKTRRTHKLKRNTLHTQKSHIKHHYDLGNDFYKLWLDKSMAYSCAYYKKPSDSLEKAQTQKIEHLLKKLQLKKGCTLLDIGSGWGTLLITAAKKYGIKGRGITLSEEQLKHARKAAKEAGVDKQVTFELQNYQDLARQNKKFDRIISVGMFEHVGRGNQAQYFTAVTNMLKDDGLTVLHTITTQTEAPQDPWIDKYIFPGGYIPSTREIVAALPEHNLRLLDYENLRIHYAMTLEEWQRRYHKHRQKILEMYDERFYRMWDLWLASSASGFRYGGLDLSQFVLSKGVNNNLPLTREHIYH